ncbi:hypothetical protein CUU13_06535 [Salmonella enterica subsp. enterica serovar Typhimurium]|nr:hypothetical protein [Salmonella enterica subsp. enterica serovar Typhimurium]
MHITYDLPVAIEDILEAKKRLAGKIYKTGMPRSNYFSERCKGEIFLKFENMQRTGSFKIRGAFNKLSSLTEAEKRKGVVACSAGNHAQGVSLSCAMLGIDGKVVMPKGAPKSKVAATCDYSAEVVLHGDNFNDTIAKVSEIVETEGRIFIPPYDDPKVIAGQGTIGLEIMEDLYDVDNVIVPIGGGGLIAGIAIAIKSINPTIKVIGVQAENVHGMAADSLSAIRYAQVKPIRDENGLAIDFAIEGEYPQYGNNDERVDSIACDLVKRFMQKISVLPTYRNAVPTQSILTITSNVVYGQKTGNTPDGRRAGTPFAPGANPMHGRDRKGAVASLTSVAKLPFTYAKDGISYTFSIVPAALGKEDAVRKTNLVGLLDGYFHHEAQVEGGQHLNVNVMNREMLLDAIEHPENYPNLTIRVSGYAVRFNALTREQQQDVISRTFTQAM